MSVKIGIIADIHLQGGLESKEAKVLMKASAILDRENVDMVIIAGDIFEDVSTEEQRLVFRNFLDSFQSTLPKLILRGNHDKPKDLMVYNDRESRSIYVSERPEIIKLRLGNLENGSWFQFLTIPHFSAGALALQSKSVEQLGEKGTNAFMDLLDSYYNKIRTSDIPSFVPFHGTISGAKLDNDKIPKLNGIHLPLGLLETFGCPVVGGHYHKFQKVGRNVWYPGSITRQTWGESLDDKGLLIWSWDGSWTPEPEFFSLDPEPMKSFNATWDGNKFIDETGAELNIDSLADEKAKIRFRYTVSKELSHTVPKDLKEKLIAIDPEAKIEKTTNITVAVRNEEIVKANDIEGSLKIYFQGKGMEASDIEAHLNERKQILSEIETKAEVTV
ncbi:metallophosphoesterase family protein [Leptospira meyeri]|uniref:metallophosphoesterase family protein n=1 Tax=Leptospira meyeri TaxID=29508 RepID=UPI0010847833|nr:metallophosphoesterase [Leptospira meyeri]TGM22009.1 calcineurin [Leptospira meyeri]